MSNFHLFPRDFYIFLRSEIGNQTFDAHNFFAYDIFSSFGKPFTAIEATHSGVNLEFSSTMPIIQVTANFFSRFHENFLGN